MTPRCTCIVGRTLAQEALAAVDTALRSGSTSIGPLAAQHSLSKATLGRHKLKCLGVRTPRDEVETPAETIAPETAIMSRAGAPVFAAEEPPTPSQQVPETPETIAYRALPPEPPGTFEARARTVAHMLTRGEWLWTHRWSRS